jgi:hypothetical protein
VAGVSVNGAWAWVLRSGQQWCVVLVPHPSRRRGRDNEIGHPPTASVNEKLLAEYGYV